VIVESAFEIRVFNCDEPPAVAVFTMGWLRMNGRDSGTSIEKPVPGPP
jgi:hypothetical protein